MTFRKQIDIVTHVYCPPGLDIYARHLLWQYASLREHTPTDILVRLKICATIDDSETFKVVARILDDMHARADAAGGATTTNVSSQVVLLEPGELFRRCIGRHRATRGTLADVVWFTDADYMFGPGALDAVARLVGPDDCAMPARVKISTDHETGQRMLDTQPLGDDGWPYINDSLFTARREKIAIGGLQIVGGNLVRARGYLRDEPSWQTPVDPELGFRSCKCDVAFRRYIGRPFARMDIPNVYRIRHTADGRDFDAYGFRKGKESW